MVLCGKINWYLFLKVVKPSDIDFGELCCWKYKILEDSPASPVENHFIQQKTLMISVAWGGTEFLFHTVSRFQMWGVWQRWHMYPPGVCVVCIYNSVHVYIV